MKKLVMDLPEINDYRMVEGLNQLDELSLLRKRY